MFLKIIDYLSLLYLFFYVSLFFTDYSFFFKPLSNSFHLSFNSLSNIIGPTFLLAVLAVIRYLLDRDNFVNSHFMHWLRKVELWKTRSMLFVLAGLIFVIFSAVSIVRHLSLSSCAFDAGIFDQALWNTTRGNMLFSSLRGNMNLLGDHFEPILLLIVPFYYLWSNCIVLYFIQALILSLAIIPLYLIAKKKLNSRLIIFAFLFSYAVSRPLRGVAYSDFHPECFILLLLFLAYYFLVTQRNFSLAVSLAFLLFCKEDTGILVSAMGLFAIFEKRIKLGLILFVCGVLSCIITTQLIIPFFNSHHEFSYMNRLPFGLTYKDNIQAVLHKPALLAELFFRGQKIEYIIKLLGPLGFLSLLSPAHYVLLGVAILKNLIPASINFSGWYNTSSHYTASVIPFVYISAIYGAGWLIQRLSSRKTVVSLSLLIIFSSLMFYGKTDAYKFQRFWNTLIGRNSLKTISYLDVLPKDASVSANLNIVPHISHRKYIYEWNPSSRLSYITEYVVVDTRLVDYLSDREKNMITPYFDEIVKNGYRKVFVSEDDSFLIYHNPGVDKTLVENFFKDGSLRSGINIPNENQP